MKTTILLLALTSCAATERHVIKRCPTTQASLVDFALAGTALALGTLAYGNGEYARTVVLVGVGGAIGLSSNLAECRR